MTEKLEQMTTKSLILAEPILVSTIEGKVMNDWFDLVNVIEEDGPVTHNMIINLANGWFLKGDFYSSAQAHLYLTGESYSTLALKEFPPNHFACPTCSFTAAEFFIKSGAIKEANEAWELSLIVTNPNHFKQCDYLEVYKKGFEKYKGWMFKETIDKFEAKLGGITGR